MIINGNCVRDLTRALSYYIFKVYLAKTKGSVDHIFELRSRKIYVLALISPGTDSAAQNPVKPTVMNNPANREFTPL